jgi:hypothetical protein
MASPKLSAESTPGGVSPTRKMEATFLAAALRGENPNPQDIPDAPFLPDLSINGVNFATSANGDVPYFGFNMLSNEASLGKLEILDREILGTHYIGATCLGDTLIPGTGLHSKHVPGNHIPDGSGWQRTARVVTGFDPKLPQGTEGLLARSFRGPDPNRVPPVDRSRYFHPLSVEKAATTQKISDHSQDGPFGPDGPFQLPTGVPPPRDLYKTEWQWEVMVHGMQPGGCAWIGVMERSSMMNPGDLGEANPLNGRRCEHLWLRDIGASGVYLYRNRQKDDDGCYPVRVEEQQTPLDKTEWLNRPKNFAVLKPERTQKMGFGMRETSFNFTSKDCFGAAEADATKYVKDRPVIGMTHRMDNSPKHEPPTTATIPHHGLPEMEESGEKPIRVVIHLHIDERTYPNGVYVDDSKITIKIEDSTIEVGEPWITFTNHFRMKKRALLPAIGASRGVTVRLHEDPKQVTTPVIPTSSDHVRGHWDLAKVQNWRDVQQFEQHRLRANNPKIDVDRSIRFAKHSIPPRANEQLPPQGLDSMVLGYARRETQNRSTFVGHITRMKIDPPIMKLPKWGEDVKPLSPAFLPYDTELVERVMPYGYIPSLGYEYVTGDRAKHDKRTGINAHESFGVLARSRSMSSSRRMQSGEKFRP